MGIIFRLVLVTLLSFFLLSCGQEKEETLKIGDSAPAFALEDLAGNEISLSGFTGSPVILRFFLTDCKYCRADTPVFNRYFARYQTQGLKILYIDSLDSSRQVLAAFKKELDIPFPIVIDPGGKISGKYQVRALPQTIILDPRHKIVAAILGGVSEEELNSTLARYINLDTP